MWKTIKKVVSGMFKVLEALMPFLLFVIILRYLFKEDVNLNDFMWFLWFLVMYGSNRIADAIKEKKDE